MSRKFVVPGLMLRTTVSEWLLALRASISSLRRLAGRVRSDILLVRERGDNLETVSITAGSGLKRRVLTCNDCLGKRFVWFVKFNDNKIIYINDHGAELNSQ